jgi:hypothetical protein
MDTVWIVVKGLLGMALRFLVAFAAIYVLTHPWLSGWDAWISVVWTVCWVAGILALQMVVHRLLGASSSLVTVGRSRPSRDLQERLEEGEELKLVFSARRAAGRLPYFMLNGEVIVVVTDRRVTVFARSAITGKPGAQWWTGEQIDVSAKDGRLELSTSGGEKMLLVTAAAYRADVEYWVPRLRPEAP